jgi:hypothetical protein
VYEDWYKIKAKNFLENDMHGLLKAYHGCAARVVMASFNEQGIYFPLLSFNLSSPILFLFPLPSRYLFFKLKTLVENAITCSYSFVQRGLL